MQLAFMKSMSKRVAPIFPTNISLGTLALDNNYPLLQLNHFEEIATGLDKHTGSTLNQEQLGKVITDKRTEILETNVQVVLRQSVCTHSSKTVGRYRAALALLSNTVTSVVPKIPTRLHQLIISPATQAFNKPSCFIESS